MKSFIAFIFVLLLAAAPVFASHEGHPHDAPAHPESEASVPGNPELGEKVKVKAKGIVCDFCVRAMEKVLLKRPEVASLKIDLTAKEVTIQLKKGQTLDDATVRELISQSGYNVEAITRE